MSSHYQHLPRINHRIRAPQVRLIDANGNNLGIMNIHKAQSLASQSRLDLIEVSAQANPPVCLIGSRGKFLYDLNKSAKRRQEQKVKEVQVGVNTAEHDLTTKVRHIREFLEKNSMVKVTIKLFGRERAHPELGIKQLYRVIAQVSDLGKVQEVPRIINHSGFLTIQPFRKTEKARPAAPAPVAVAA